MSYRKHHIKPKIRYLRRKRKPLVRRPWFWLALLGALGVASAGYGVVFSRALAVSNIQVQGNQQVATRDIVSAVQQAVRTPLMHLWPVAISSNSIVLADKRTVASAVLRLSPFISSVTVQKRFPHTVSVTVQERSAVAAFCDAGGQCVAIDKSGVAFTQLASVPDGMLQVNAQSMTTGVPLGQDVVPPPIMRAIEEVQQNLKDRFQIDVPDVLVSNNLVFQTSEGWKAYISPELDVPAQLQKLDTLLNSQITPAARKRLQYIYLQFQDRAYYR